jgi:Domain of unknown function (DUF3472)
MKIARMAMVAAFLIAATVWSPTAAHADGPVVSVAVTSGGDGYVAVDSGGVVHAFGAVVAAGSPTGFSGTITSVSTTGNGQGYAAVSSRGQVYAYGAVRYRANPTGFSGTIVGISVTADGQGYAAISSTGQVYAYGTVRHRGNPTGFSGTIVGISVTADGQGYAAISSTGQVYAYGTVRHRGNPTGFSGTITGVSVTADGQGYAAVSSRAQTYAYGTVRSRGNPYDFFGTAGGIAVTGDGQGYSVVTTGGQIHTYGSVGFRGDFPDVANQNSTQHLRAARYVDWSYPTNAQIYNVDQTAYVVAKARSTYWSLNWSWTDTTRSSGGYMGLQTDGQRFDGTTGDTALFSLWDANGSRGGNCGRFDGEGEGRSCRLAYPIYGDGNSYRLRVWRLEADADGQWWGAWIQDSRRGDVSIGELRVPLGATSIASANDFTEYFGSPAGCDGVPQSLVNWGTPRFRAATGDGSATFASSLKSSCAGGTAARTTISGGIPVVHAFLGGARPGA